jgi:hypothetical protein
MRFEINVINTFNSLFHLENTVNQVFLMEAAFRFFLRCRYMNYTGVPIRFTAGLVLSLLICSCSKENDPGVVVDFPKTFEVGIQEVFEGNARLLKLQLRTLEVFECAGAQIDLSIERTYDLIELSVNEIIQPDTCHPLLQAASGSADAGMLEDGNWPIVLNLRQTILNHGQMVVKPGSIELLMFTQYGIVPGRTLLRRIPPQTIWGYIAYPTPALSNVASEVLATLDSLGARPAFFPPGYYSDFTVLPSGALQIPLPEIERTYLLFLHRFEGSYESMQSIISPYLAGHDELEIRVFFHDGRAL